MKAKKKGSKRAKPINYDTGPAYSATSNSRSVADKKYNAKAAGSGLKSKLFRNPDGSYTRKSVDSSPAEYKGGGKLKVRKRKAKFIDADGNFYKVKTTKDGSQVRKFKHDTKKSHAEAIDKMGRLHKEILKKKKKS